MWSLHSLKPKKVVYAHICVYIYMIMKGSWNPMSAGFMVFKSLHECDLWIFEWSETVICRDLPHVLRTLQFRSPPLPSWTRFECGYQTVCLRYEITVSYGASLRTSPWERPARVHLPRERPSFHRKKDVPRWSLANDTRLSNPISGSAICF